MIIAIIKSLLYLFILYIFYRISNFIIKFIYNLLNKKEESPKTKNENSLSMNQCEICKTYITKSESYKKDGKTYCEDHK